jgi:protein involved in polysaccharide export with SLBB domain
LPALGASGRAVPNLQNEIDVKYSALGLDVFVSLIPRVRRAGAAVVIGEVGKPGRIEFERPATVLMAVGQAGGVLPSGSMEAVRVFYSGDDGMQRLRSINLKEVIDDLRLEEDMIVPNNSVIYVPPTDLAKTGRLLDAVVRDILRFQGFSVGGSYIFNGTITTNP